MARYLIVLPCDLCTRVPARYVARCGLLVCAACWAIELRQDQED